jgi:ribonuclease III
VNFSGPARIAIEAAAECLGYRFGDASLSRTAIVHRSSDEARDGSDSERLEFLGDAVLELLARELLLERHPADSEGSLTRLKAHLVSERALAMRGRALGLDRCVLVGSGLEPGSLPDSIVAGTSEALLGAVFLDGGLAAARDVARRAFLEPLLQAVPARPEDPCSRLQELCQGCGRPLPEYSVERAGGLDHEPCFNADVTIAGVRTGRGSGGSKKEAQRAAAEEALKVLESEE